MNILDEFSGAKVQEGGKLPWVNSQQRWSPALNGCPNDDRQGGDNNGAAEEGALSVTKD